MIVQSTSIFGFPGLTNKTTTMTAPTAAATIYNRNSERDSGDSDRERVGDRQIENNNKDGTDKELLINKKKNKENSIPITMTTPARENTNKPDSNYPAHPPRPPIDHSKSTSSSRTIRPTSSFSSSASTSSPAYPHPHPLSTPSGSANPAKTDADTVYSPGNHGVFIRRQSQQTSSCFSSDDSNCCGAASLVSPVDSAVSVGAQSVESRGTVGSGETEGTSYSGRNSDEKQYIDREQGCEGVGDSDRTVTQGQRYGDAETDTDTDTETNTDMAMSTTLDPALATSATAEPPFSSSSPDLPPPPSFTTIKIKDLAHLGGLVKANLLTGHPTTLPTPSTIRYDISAMPVEDVITMVAGLLSKITATNDEHHDPAAVMRGGIGRSVLAFHGKNVPAISIASYLGRVHRYCPTTYEVFLSLLVYFDRMTERVNEEGESEVGAAKMGTETETGTEVSTGETSTRKEDDRREEEDVDMDSESDIADDDDDEDDHERHTKESSSGSTGGAASGGNGGGGGYFVVDSYNIHRLIIAGVTCASKFFSDVFYTNSRYAKVGGLPLPELNHLELQFLILNDFRLFIPPEDLEAYATMLVEFYAREVVSVEINNGVAVSGAAVVAVVAGMAKT